METNRIKERLLKMYRLANDGVDGEKETAQKMLEADLDEGGFNDLKKDILTLVNLIPCNDGNESVINDIKNLLK